MLMTVFEFLVVFSAFLLSFVECSDPKLEVSVVVC